MTRNGMSYEEMLRARLENLRRLARALGVPEAGRNHQELCSAVRRWYKRNPQPRRDKR